MPACEQAFQRETELFFNAILRENRPVTDLLAANFTYLNERLAQHYGIPNVYGSQFRRVALTDQNRGGLLGQGSILTVTSYPNRTSVVQRGKWVLENLLGSPPPPPPPDVPPLEAHAKDGKLLTMRQQMEQHRTNPVCASCHARMDPIGFALENYDGIGTWRAKDAGSAIDAAGKLPDGTKFEGPAGLDQAAADQVPRRVHRDLHRQASDLRARPRARVLRQTRVARDRARCRARQHHHSRTDPVDREESAISDEENSRVMMITKKSVSRRTLLAGLGRIAGSAAAGRHDPGDGRHPAAAAKPAVRLGFVYVPNGIIPKGWLPTKTGTGLRVPLHHEAARAVPRQDAGAEQSDAARRTRVGRWRGRPCARGRNLAHRRASQEDRRLGYHAGISADQIAAREFGKITQFGSLEIGLEEPTLAGGCDTGYSCAYTNTISWRTPTTPNPMEINPRAVFERLFGDGDSTDAASRIKRMHEDRSILDFVREDVARLKPGLGTRDKGKLDEYLEGIRDIERRIQKAEEQSATMKLPVMERPTSIPDEFEDHAKLMSDLMVIAFQTDMTRVVSFMMAREGSNRSYRSIGVSDGHHSVTHHQNDPEKIEKTMKIDELHVKTFAYLVDKLKSTPDGDGIAARSFHDSLRQQHLRRQRPHASRSAAGAGGRRGGSDQGRTAHPLCAGNADEQPAADHAR